MQEPSGHSVTLCTQVLVMPCLKSVLTPVSPNGNVLLSDKDDLDM